MRFFWSQYHGSLKEILAYFQGNIENEVTGTHLAIDKLQEVGSGREGVRFTGWLL